MPFVPTLLLGLLLAASRLFRSLSVPATKSKPRPPRRPTLAVVIGPVPDEVYAIVRLSWFRQGRPFEVEEFRIYECDDARVLFQGSVGQALRMGADVSVMTTYSAESLGIPTA
jgi:hypothetical protein